MHFCTLSASLAHLAAAYSLTTCRLTLTTQSARVRFLALSDIFGILEVILDNERQSPVVPRRDVRLRQL